MDSIKKRERKVPWIYCFGIIILFLLPYLIVNHLPLDRYILPFILGEENIPFLPWTFSIYLSFFLFGAFAVRNVPKKFLMKAITVISGVIFISLIFFIIFPIEYPRSLYPSSNTFVQTFRNGEPPGNCFPSLHVSITVILLLCLDLLLTSRIKKFLVWTWGMLIVFSVLTTKQHYLIDIIGGIILAVPAALYLRREFAK